MLANVGIRTNSSGLCLSFDTFRLSCILSIDKFRLLIIVISVYVVLINERYREKKINPSHAKHNDMC